MRRDIGSLVALGGTPRLTIAAIGRRSLSMPFRSAPPCSRPAPISGQFPMKTLANVIDVARSNLAAHAKHPDRKLVGRRPQPDENLVGEIKGVLADLPTYGYRRVHAILRRRAAAEGRQRPNH